jgi:hypothetical protein
MQPLTTVIHQLDHCSLYGAVEPTTGASCLLARPALNRRAFQLWLDGFAAACPAALHLLVLDHGAGPKAKTVRGPSHVVPVFLPP